MTWLPSAIRLGVVAAILKTLFSYLDPGSGSLIIQILIAIVVGIAATFRIWKTRLLSLFGMKQETNDDDGDDLEANDITRA